MKPIEHYGHFEGGKLHADSFKAALRALAGKTVVLTVKEYRETRSNQANRYYWGIVVELIYRALNEGGIEVTREGTHELLKFRFLKEDRPIKDDGEFITIIRSTTELDKYEFGTYIEECVRFAAEYLNVVIPEPNTQSTLELA